MSSLTNKWDQSETHTQQQTTIAWLSTRVPTLLRLLGSTAVVIAMYSFLAKGWESANDVYRYFLLLVHTGLLAAIGLATGHWLRESVGARVFLTLALTSVPANFAILGALIMSQSPSAALSDYPTYLTWTAQTLSSALSMSAVAILVLLPVTFLGFAVLVRSLSKNLASLFLCSNMVLLLPLRTPELIAVLAVVLTVCIITFSRHITCQSSASRTQEGIIALGLQFLPLAVLMVRTLWLYSADQFLQTVLFLIVFLFLRQITLSLDPNSTAAKHTNDIALFPATMVTLLLGSALYDLSTYPQVLVLPTATLAGTAMIFDLAQRSRHHSQIYRRLACASVLAGAGVNLVLYHGVVAALVCTLTGTGLSIFGYRKHQRSVFFTGLLLVTAGIGQQLYEVARYFNLGGWAGLALTGMIAIFIASAIESRGGNFRPRIDRYLKHLQQWQH